MGVHKGEQPAGPQEQTDDQVRRQALKGEGSAEIYRETNVNVTLPTWLDRVQASLPLPSFLARARRAPLPPPPPSFGVRNYPFDVF